MNERIKVLAKQAADFTTDEVAHLERVHNRTYTLDEVTAVYNEKFAELIVQECAQTAAMFSIDNKRIHPEIDPRDMTVANQMVYHSTCQSVAYEIKEHVGLNDE